ncbi:putative harbinger transposase-derived protein [Helianthus annuus]|nr:putative harbinger transposase-derived protein [Helianthus annuus]
MVRTFFRKLLRYLSSEDDSDDDLDEDVEEQCTRKRRKFIRRNHIQGHERLYRDYFAENPVYPSNLFRRRFRMSRPLFLRILNEVVANEPYFVQRRDNIGRLGLSSMQKITAALRMLAYGVSADFMDEYIRIGESTAMESLKKFCETIVSIFSVEYLRSPNTNDLWIWHAFFGLPGSYNDINVLERSSVFTELAQGRAPPVNYTVNGHDYTMGYYLADGIYPKWQTFVKTIPSPRGNKNKYFAKAQESARKDVERAFGVLQQRFAIIRGPSRMFKLKIKDSSAHHQLQEDLIEHQWLLYSQQ